MQFEYLFVAVGERSHQLAFTLIQDGRWPFVELSGLGRKHFYVKLHDLQWLQTEHSLGLLGQHLLLCLFTRCQWVLGTCVRLALNDLKLTGDSEIEDQVCLGRV